MTPTTKRRRLAELGATVFKWSGIVFALTYGTVFLWRLFAALIARAVS